MRRGVKPLWGFGWAGLALLPVAVALGWVYLSGYDLRFDVQQWINDWLGWQAQYWFVSVWLPGQYFGARDPVVGMVTLMYLLVAMHLHPRRFGWRYLAVTGWALIR